MKASIYFTFNVKYLNMCWCKGLFLSRWFIIFPATSCVLLVLLFNTILNFFGIITLMRLWSLQHNWCYLGISSVWKLKLKKIHPNHDLIKISQMQSLVLLFLCNNIYVYSQHKQLLSSLHMKKLPRLPHN